MDRDDLVALRDALSALIELPEHLRETVAGFLRRPAPPKSNGADHDPPPRPAAKEERRKPMAQWGKPTPEQVGAAEAALMQAIRDNPGTGTVALGKLTNSNTSTTVGRLKRLELRGRPLFAPLTLVSIAQRSPPSRRKPRAINGQD